MVKQTQLFELQSENSTQKLTFYSSLEKLNRACRKCDRCPLSQQRQQVVIGRGKIKPDLAVIGEAPGKLEDKAGQPFVGDSVISSKYRYAQVCCVCCVLPLSKERGFRID